MEKAGTATWGKKSIALAVALAAALTLGSPAGNANAGARKRIQSQLLSLHNAARQAEGIRTLRGDSKLARYARHHSKAMSEQGSLLHTSNLARPLRGRNWSIAGENIGSTQVGNVVDSEGVVIDTITVEEAIASLHTAFIDSPEHRENILRSSFDHAAVGTYEAKGVLWVTVIFYG